MALLLRARNALRHASSITLEDLVQVLRSKTAHACMLGLSCREQARRLGFCILCLPKGTTFSDLLPTGASLIMLRANAPEQNGLQLQGIHRVDSLLADFPQVEGSLKIWWAIAGEDDLGAEAITNLTDPTEHQWGENKLEAKQTEEYMQMLKDKVGRRRSPAGCFQGDYALLVSDRGKQLISDAFNIHKLR
jgi:hypothetical protein